MKAVVYCLVLISMFFCILGPTLATDFNGDGKNDIAIYRPNSGLWAIRGITRLYFGSEFDIPVPGDYDGDGVVDIAIGREGGLWAIRDQTRIYFGETGDIPITGGGGTQVGRFTAGDKIIGYTPCGGTKQNYWTKVAEFAFGQGGTIKATFSLRLLGSYNEVYARIYRNDNPVGIERYTTSTHPVTFSEDISGWEPGDTCELWMRLGGTSPYCYAEYMDFKIQIGPGQFCTYISPCTSR